MIVKTDQDAIKSYLEDSSNLKGGWAEEAVFPQSPEEISEILIRASRAGRPVTVSGGGTGAVGARVPRGGIVLSLERMNQDIDISRDVSQGIWLARCQAGVLVEDLKKKAESEGLFYACHPTEKTAALGGTVATNASGARSLRYGPTRRFVRALKVVLSAGDILYIKRGSRFISKKDSTVVLKSGRKILIPIPSYKMPAVKNSAGYYAKDGMDLIDLFVGQEGTLCVIAEVSLELEKRPEEIFSCFAFFSSEEKSWSFSQDALALDPLSMEYFDHNAIVMLMSKGLNIPRYAKAAIFFEKDTKSGKTDEAIEEWRALFKEYGAREEDAWAEIGEGESGKFIELRHSIPDMVNARIRRAGCEKISIDSALPRDRFPEMMNFYVESLGKALLEHVIFGHIGECHVHVNILPQDEEVAAAKALALQFVRKAVLLGGTVSAEHGIGKIKHAYLEELYGREGVLEMARIKKALDPAWILGPDNIFPAKLAEEL